MESRAWIGATCIVTMVWGMGGCCAYDESDHPPVVDDDDLADETDGDDDTNDVSAAIVNTYPEDGDTSFYHRNDIIIDFDAAAPDATVVLVEDEGAMIPGINTLSNADRTLTFDPYGDDPTEHLEPGTSYTAWSTWQGQSADLHFSIWEEGGGSLCWGVEGQNYFVDLGSATFTEPPGIGSLLAQYIADVYLIIRVLEVDESEEALDLIAATCDKDGNDYVQDPCVPTYSLGEDTELDCPYFEARFEEYVFQIEDTRCAVWDMTFGGSFSADTRSIAGGILAGEMDARCLDALIDPHGGEGAACELLASLGIDCQACSDGSGPTCLAVDAHGIYSESVDVITFDPEMGEEMEGLLEITEPTVADWEAVGYCP